MSEPSGSRHEQRAAEAIRERGYIDLRSTDDISEWVEDVLQPVLAVLREQGWTVTPPE